LLELEGAASRCCDLRKIQLAAQPAALEDRDGEDGDEAGSGCGMRLSILDSRQFDVELRGDARQAV